MAKAKGKTMCVRILMVMGVLWFGFIAGQQSYGAEVVKKSTVPKKLNANEFQYWLITASGHQSDKKYRMALDIYEGLLIAAEEWRKRPAAAPQPEVQVKLNKIVRERMSELKESVKIAAEQEKSDQAASTGIDWNNPVFEDVLKVPRMAIGKKITWNVSFVTADICGFSARPDQSRKEGKIIISPQKGGSTRVCDDIRRFGKGDLITVEGTIRKVDDGVVMIDADKMINATQTQEQAEDSTAKVDTKDELYNATPLALAAKKGDIAIIKDLIKRGANVNAANDSDRVTALMYAAERGKLEAVKVLLENGANVHIRDVSLGKTALWMAAGEGHGDIVKILLKAGARIDSGPVGFTPLMWAISNGGHEETVKTLLDAGASLDVKDGEGKTALRLAEENGFEKIATMLKQRGATE